MASITWNDGTARTLTNSLSAPGNRFRAWTPIPTVIGARRVALIGIPHVYRRRTAWRVSGRIELLKPLELDVAQWAIVHLQNGGQVTLNTGDLASRTYTAYLAADDSAAISDPDEASFGEHVFSFALSIYPAPATPPLCIY